MLAYVLFRTQRYDERIWPSAGEDQTDRPASLVHRDLSKSLVAHSQQILQMDVGGMQHQTFLRSIALLGKEVSAT
jgi:hypothetical protein